MTERKARATASAKATAKAKATAGPSASLRFAQDDRIFFGWREINGRFPVGMTERKARATTSEPL
jgi:hypothetical protein